MLADAAVFRAFGVWPTAAVTAVTAQNTMGVDAVAVMDPGLVRAQITAVVRDIGVDAVKTGMLGSGEVASVVATTLRGLPAVVVDPVLASSSGTTLLDADGRCRWFEAERDPSVHTHGTGCVLSAAIAARLALGDGLVDAVQAGREAVRRAIRAGLAIGSGGGPVDAGAVLSSPAS